MNPTKPTLWAPRPGEKRKGWEGQGRTSNSTADAYEAILQTLRDQGGKVEHDSNATGILRSFLPEEMKDLKPVALSSRLNELHELGWIDRLINGRRTYLIELKASDEDLDAVLPPESPVEVAIVALEKLQATQAKEIFIEEPTSELPHLPDLELLNDQMASTIAAHLLRLAIEGSKGAELSEYVQLQHITTQNDLAKARRRLEVFEEDLASAQRSNSRLQAEIASQREIILGLERNLNRALSASSHGVSVRDIVGESTFRELKRLMQEVPNSARSRSDT